MILYFNSGGNDGSARNEILEYDPETKEWTKIGTMRESRYVHGMSVVYYSDYADFCQ